MNPPDDPLSPGADAPDDPLADLAAHVAGEGASAHEQPEAPTPTVDVGALAEVIDDTLAEIEGALVAVRGEHWAMRSRARLATSWATALAPLLPAIAASPLWPPVFLTLMWISKGIRGEVAARRAARLPTTENEEEDTRTGPVGGRHVETPLGTAFFSA